MHTCLNVDELVRLIARELVVSNAKATAVALACCRRSFEHPVLDALWETQEQLLPLLRPLPADVWNEGGCTPFRSLPNTPEWARFRWYAGRMRKLGVLGALDARSSKMLSVLHLCAIDESLFPNLKILDLWISQEFIPSIPLFLSQRTTVVTIAFNGPEPSQAMAASMITAFQTLCPNLQDIAIYTLPRDPMVTAAVSEMALAVNRDVLQCFNVDSPLTDEACGVVFKLPNLRLLCMIIEEDPSSPTVVLPNLTNLEITYHNDNGWLRMFSGATFGKLQDVTFHSEPERIEGFLEEFERVALAASIQNTLRQFSFYTSHSWNPNYPSLLPFTRLEMLIVEFSCDGGCSSSVDDDIVMDLARAMPGLTHLELGGPPCRESPAGVTAKGLVALAYHCPNLDILRIHFQVFSLSSPSEMSGMTPNAGFTAPRKDCALTELDVGEIAMPEESVLTVALTLVQIFPHITEIHWVDKNWEEVVDAICVSRGIIDHSRAVVESSS